MSSPPRYGSIVSRNRHVQSETPGVKSPFSNACWPTSPSASQSLTQLSPDVNSSHILSPSRDAAARVSPSRNRATDFARSGPRSRDVSRAQQEDIKAAVSDMSRDLCCFMEKKMEDMSFEIRSQLSTELSRLSGSGSVPEASPFSDAMFEVKHRTVRMDVADIVDEVKNVDVSVKSLTSMLKSADTSDMLRCMQSLKPELHKLAACMSSQGQEMDQRVKDLHDLLRANSESLSSRDQKLLRILESQSKDAVAAEATHERYINQLKTLGAGIESLQKSTALHGQVLDRASTKADLHKDEVQKCFEGVHAAMEQNKLVVDHGPVLRSLDRLSESVLGHFDRMSKRADQSGTELSGLSSSLTQAIEQSRCDVRAHVEGVHKKFDAIDVNQIVKTVHTHQDEMQSHFERLQRKVDVGSIEAALGSVQKALQDHKTDLSGHFERVHRKVEQSKVTVDLDPLLKAIDDQSKRMHGQLEQVHMRTNQKDMESAMAMLQKSIQDQRNDFTNHVDSIHRSIEDHGHVKAMDSVVKKLKDHKDEIGQHFEAMKRASSQGKEGSLDSQSLEKVLDLHHDRMRRNLEPSKGSSDVDKLMKLMEASKSEMNNHFERFHRKADQANEGNRSLDDHKIDMANRFDQLTKKLDSAKSSAEAQSEKMFRAFETHRSGIGEHLERSLRRADQSGGSNDVSAVRRLLEDHTVAIDAQFSKLQKSVSDKSLDRGNSSRREDRDSQFSSVLQAIQDHSGVDLLCQVQRLLKDLSGELKELPSVVSRCMQEQRKESRFELEVKNGQEQMQRSLSDVEATMKKMERATAEFSSAISYQLPSKLTSIQSDIQGQSERGERLLEKVNQLSKSSQDLETLLRSTHPRSTSADGFSRGEQARIF